MHSTYHTFYIPVMGTGHSADTPIRVAPLGISSVISLVDDLMLDQLRHHYCGLYGLPCEELPRRCEDGRARRITAYLDMVHEIVRRRFEAIQRQPFFEANDKASYFRLLPDGSPLRRDYAWLLALPPGSERDRLAQHLTASMRPGSIDVNIMATVDRVVYDADGNRLDDIHRDAMAALRGYARSVLSSSVVFSAGINQRLYSYLTRFADFYRGRDGRSTKRIVLKVSDLRSAIVQGKLLAKKGLEVYEYRVESGLNCGGHVFATNGHLLPGVLQEFRDKRDQLVSDLRPLVIKYYEGMGWHYPQAGPEERPLITAQGGVGTHGEARRLLEDYGLDGVGWGSPFLLVPEATSVDEATREQLRAAGADEIYVSDASPLGVPFSNLRHSVSERRRAAHVAAGTPGSPCPKGYARLNAEYGEPHMCTASSTYQRRKLAEIEALDAPSAEKEALRRAVVARSCICDHLGNGALIALGLADAASSPPAVCPGPNLAWFDRLYSLEEMVDHIYGRGAQLTPADRPHMVAQELALYVDHLERQLARTELAPTELKALRQYVANLHTGIDQCLHLADKVPYPGENLASIAPCVSQQRERLVALSAALEKRV